ncbi:MAG: hypothetical protein M1832_004645 [Thelocarpon impressellum]|nr:MAG: hypothetical protein M1832_004645 [Thelocarpon impressellum]
MTVPVAPPSGGRRLVDKSITGETSRILAEILRLAGEQLPREILCHVPDVTFTSAVAGYPVYFPCPFKETETTSALKAVEACAAAAIAGLRYRERRRKIEVDTERATCFLFATYLSAVDGMDKQDPNVWSRLKDTDLLKAQSILYRRLSANLYETREPGEYFYLHGSLEATTALNMVGLEGHRPDLTDYRECIDVIEEHVRRFSAKELEKMNAENRQAGVTCLTWEQFQRTGHGAMLVKQPPWLLDTLEDSSPPVPFSEARDPSARPQVLAGVKVVELCRIIAGPVIGRTLAEYGADVMKVTSPNLSDVPFFQVDGNMGKHAVDLNLSDPANRRTFEGLLREADVVLDGYRPGALDRLGYGPQQIIELTKGRGKGIVYISEDCFGHQGEWANRPGWQQIADSVTGIAWAQGAAMGLNEPVVPPFPMSDYGTGCMGAIAALTGLFKRAKYGGSYHGKVSLAQYDVLLLRMGLYPADVQALQRATHDSAFYELRHHDSVEEVSRRAMNSMKRLHPQLFDPKYCHEAPSPAFKAPVRYVRSAVRIDGLRNGFCRSSRPNGSDRPTWDGWETEEAFVDA